jgi:hypothetical protein
MVMGGGKGMSKKQQNKSSKNPALFTLEVAAKKIRKSVRKGRYKCPGKICRILQGIKEN